MSIQTRPKKTVKRLRFSEGFTRCQAALDMSKPSSSNMYDPLAMETSELEFTFVNCVKDSGISESPKSQFKGVPRVDIFNCLDNNQDFFNNSSQNMELEWWKNFILSFIDWHLCDSKIAWARGWVKVQILFYHIGIFLYINCGRVVQGTSGKSHVLWNWVQNF